jgi:hypothetical protein
MKLKYVCVFCGAKGLRGAACIQCCRGMIVGRYSWPKE